MKASVSFFSLANILPTIVLKLLVVLTLITASGCSWLFGDEGFFPSKADAYLDAEEGQEIVLPEGIESDSISTEYPIPELALSQVLPTKFEVPRLESLDTVDNKGSVRVQRFEGEQWILVNSAPGQTWPLIASFLTSNAIPLAVADGTRGLIETDWLEAKVIDASADLDLDLKDLGKERQPSATPASNLNEKYQFLLKAGVQKETTEIVVVHRSHEVSNEETPAPDWTGSSTSQLREDNMVRLLSEHLAGSPNQASHSLLAQGLGSASKVRLRYDDSGMPSLSLQLPFDRAWASLGLALKKASYEVSDLDRSKGVYYVYYVEPADKPKKRGFFKRLFGIGKAKAKALAESAEADLLQISTHHDGSALIISIQREAQPLLRSNEQAFMLRRIQNKLS